jgi:DNA topoisomerase-1
MLDQSFDTSAKARLILAAILRVNAKRQSAADLARRRALRPVHGIADAMRSELKRAFLKSFNKDEINDEASALAAVDRNYDVLNGFLIGLLHRGVIASGQVHSKIGIKTLSEFRTLLPREQHFFDSSNPASIEWAREHAGKLITSMKEDAKAAVRTIIADGIEKGRSVGDTADLLKDAVGLTDRQAGALLDYEEQLDAEGLSKSEIRDELAARAEEMTDARAETIARTETMAAANEGQQELWNQAIENGLLTGREMKEWIYTPDGNACPDCEELDGQTVPVDEEFPDGDPPLHPNCRCTFGISASDERTLRAAGGPGSGPQGGRSKLEKDYVASLKQNGLNAPETKAAFDRLHEYDTRNETSRIFFHGTSSQAAEKIMKEGLIPKGSKGADAWLLEVAHDDISSMQLDDRELSVFITQQFGTAEEYADYAAEVNPGSKAVVLRVDVPKSELSKLTVDEFSADPTGADVYYKGAIPKKWISVVSRVEKMKSAADVGDVESFFFVILTDEREDRDTGVDAFKTAGGPGSGNFGHEGRPGEVGGAGASAGWSGPKTDQDRERIAKLGVPPAWTDVRLNPDPSGDLQATGRDSKGRTQYLYSAEHSERASAEKFERLKEFNKEVGQIQEKIQADLDNPNLSQKDAESARALYLISKTGFRVGSEESSVYGATTLRAEHVKIDGEKVVFNFVGKHNVPITKEVEDKQLATILKPRVDAGGRLFQTTDSEVRDYLHARDGDFKVKDFRTWQGTARAIQEVKSLKTPKTDREFKIARMKVARAVAAHLGNTPKVALDSYISPTVFSKWKSRL